MSEFSGHLRLRAEVRGDGRSVLAEQGFRAPFHVGKSYWDDEARTLRVQVVNPTAGILAGDRLESAISAGAGAALIVTTPSVSRVFQMRAGEAVCAQRFAVEAGGWLEFLPEPLVPHRESNYRQTTEIDVEAGGELVFADFLTPGRIARGETWAWRRLRLELAVRVGGELILRERLDQSGEELRALAELAGVGGGGENFNREGTRRDAKSGELAEGGAPSREGVESGACCFGNVVLVSRRLDEESGWRDAVAGLHGPDAWVGLSALRGECGGWSLKVIATDSVAMRRVMGAAREILSERLPRMAVGLRRV